MSEVVLMSLNLVSGFPIILLQAGSLLHRPQRAGNDLNPTNRSPLYDPDF